MGEPNWFPRSRFHPPPAPWPEGRAECAVHGCPRPVARHPDWDCHRPIQRYLLPADLCGGHGQIRVMNQAIGGPFLISDSDIADSLKYIKQALAHDLTMFGPKPVPPAHYVYRIRGESGELLYIGETNDVTRRMREHSKSKEWWNEFREISQVPYATRHEAKSAEEYAIRFEHPKYNIVYANA